MPNNLIDRLRSAANAIDDTGDVELRKLLADAAEEMERLEFSSRHNADMYRQMDDAREEALQEVEQLKAQNERLSVALWQALQGWEYDGISDEHGSVYRECDKRSKESPTQSLAEIQAQAVESLLSDLRRDTADTNPARHIFQRMQLRVDVLRQSVKKPITNPSEISSQLVDGASNKQEQQP
jgi:hypothetical protein